ncbi:MAG: PAS domain-containing protein [Rhodospirillaceae bacterium]|nr:PAS domain-containing protein [Rhodospirillaceae bacterium]
MPPLPSLDGLQLIWDELCGGNALPPHSAFGPEILKPWLSHLAIVEVHQGPRRFYYRLAGSVLEDRFGIDFTGRWLEDLRIPGSPGYWEQHYAAVAQTRRPQQGSVAHFDPRFNQKVCNWLMLPLLPDLKPRGGPGPLDLVILVAVAFAKA